MEPTSSKAPDAWDPAADPVEPDWVGPQAFTARHSHSGVDQDLGMRWGPRWEQRIAFHRKPGADHGLRYAYDPTWDEYAVLAADAPLAAVHMHVLAFAELVRCHQLPATVTPDRAEDTSRVVAP
jgi:hypothetical protein